MERYILEEGLEDKFLESGKAARTLRLYANVACLNEYKLLNPDKIRSLGNSASVYDPVKALDANSQLERLETIRARRFCELLIGQLPQSRQHSMVDRDAQWNVHWEEVVSNAKEGVSMTRVPIMLIKEGQLQDLIEGCKSTVSTLQGHALFSLPLRSDLIGEWEREVCVNALQTISEFCDALEEFRSLVREDGSGASTAGSADGTYEGTAYSNTPPPTSDNNPLGDLTEADSAVPSASFGRSSRPSRSKSLFRKLGKLLGKKKY
jgi:hypothetical protein